MKHLFILLMLISFSAMAQDNLNKFEWILGSWNRTNAKPGRSGIETWKKISDTEFVGKGISLKGADTTFVEKLKIILRDRHVFYVADVPENKGLVYFKLTSSAGNTLTFENQEHDFPKKIYYELINGKLKAVVSGNNKSIDYFFEKK